MATPPTTSRSFTDHSIRRRRRLIPRARVRTGDEFNEHTLGRNQACGVAVQKPPLPHDKLETARQDWAYGMISNTHCRIYCILEQATRSTQQQYDGTLATTTRTAAAAIRNDTTLQVFIEDTSGNGTRINKTINFASKRTTSPAAAFARYPDTHSQNVLPSQAAKEALTEKMPLRSNA
jgi:hypothetical protein